MLIIACILSGMVGALGMAILSAGAYDRGYGDGYKDSDRDAEWLKDLLGSDEDEF